MANLTKLTERKTCMCKWAVLQCAMHVITLLCPNGVNAVRTVLLRRVAKAALLISAAFFCFCWLLFLQGVTVLGPNFRKFLGRS